jgi:DNA processing protein
MDLEPTPVDTLVERSGFPAKEISSMLLMLELQGLVETAPGGLYYRPAGGDLHS